MTLTVISPGLQTLVQDDGRFGHAASGVGTAGAFDRAAHRQANALVGNAADAAVLEVVGGGLRLRAEAEHTVSVTGAVGPIHVDRTSVEHGRTVVLFAGQELSIGSFAVGLRGYVAIAGGVDAEPVLGSRAFDTLAGIGPAPLAAGDTIRAGSAHTGALDVDDVPALLTSGTTAVDVVLGPRADWFTPESVFAFRTTGWTVSPVSNRVGIRLDGPRLERANTTELPSEPCVFGSIQVTSGGQPVVLGPDHPVTGGYPVIAVVAETHLDRLAQLRPGEVLRLRSRQPRR
jgi:biotin-dependent carboxylase-like uncharacterized protein